MAATVLQNIDKLFTGKDTEGKVVEDGADQKKTLPPQIEGFLQRELSSHLSKKRNWRMLDRCVKWTLVQAYLRDKGIAETDPIVGDVRACIQKDKLTDVEYDRDARKIVVLNYRDL